MSRGSRMLAGILCGVLPTVMFGGLWLLSLLTRSTAGYVDNPLRHDLFRAGHAHVHTFQTGEESLDGGGFGERS
jgi:hypothetical protein